MLSTGGFKFKINQFLLEKAELVMTDVDNLVRMATR